MKHIVPIPFFTGFKRAVLVLMVTGVEACSSIAYGQIVKDTLKGKYGSHTVWTRTIDNEKYHQIDTSISNVYQFDPKYRTHDFYQDLGAFGSVYRKQFNFSKERSVFKELSEDHFEEYGFKYNRKFYKTLTPYVRLNYDLGTIGGAFFDGVYTRNMTRTSNIGFQFRRLISKGLYPVVGYENQVNSTALRFFGSYESKNKRYKAVADFNMLNYQTAELGGIDLDTLGVLPGYFRWGNLDATLDADSRYEGRQLFLDHSVSIDTSGILRFFHQLDAGSNVHKFVDADIFSSESELEFYLDSSNVRRNYLKTFDQWEYQYVRNEVGLKGNWKKVNYRTSFHQRTYVHELFGESQGAKQEVALQIGGGLQVNDSTHVRFNILQAVSGAFNYTGKLKFKFLEAEVYSMNSLPYLIQERHSSNHYDWSNPDLKNTFVNGAKVFLTNGKKNWKVGATYDVISNYTYWDSNFDVVQENSVISVLSPEAWANVDWKRFNVVAHVKYNLFTGNKVLGLPDINGKLKVFYDLQMFKGALESNLGAEVRTYSDYYAYGYMPVFHEFYYQNGMKSFATPYLTGFFDFKVKTVRMFVRGENLLEYVTGWNFQTPYHPTRPLNVAVGVEWRFFD